MRAGCKAAEVEESMSTMGESVPDEQEGSESQNNTVKHNLPVMFYVTDMPKENMFDKLTNYCRHEQQFETNRDWLFTHLHFSEEDHQQQLRVSFYDQLRRLNILTEEGRASVKAVKASIKQLPNEISDDLEPDAEADIRNQSAEIKGPEDKLSEEEESFDPMDLEEFNKDKPKVRKNNKLLSLEQIGSRDGGYKESEYSDVYQAMLNDMSQ